VPELRGIGAGAISLFVCKTPEDRATAMAAIGPFWNGNEVWLIAAGGALFFTFPLLYASAFSGFYLPLMIVLWLLILRGISIELRSHSHDALWRTFFDGLFTFASALLALFFGAPLSATIVIAVLLATIGMAAVGCLFAAMVARVRARELLLPLLALPLFSVSRQSLAALVPEERRRTAYSLDSMSVEASFAVGPAVGVLVVTQVQLGQRGGRQCVVGLEVLHGFQQRRVSEPRLFQQLAVLAQGERIAFCKHSS